MADPSLFHGIAIIVDDEVGDADAKIDAIQKQIEAVGCHVVTKTALPDEPAVANFGAASFFIVDWNMYGIELPLPTDGTPVVLPTGLQRRHTAEMVGFLKNLKKVRFAPVFIFTNENVEEVEDELKKHPDLYDENDPSHILVKSKSEVLEKGVFNLLGEWLQQAPSAYVLKRWEAGYEKAKNELFLDFYAKSVHWPLILKETFEKDEVSPSVELGNLIGRNLLSRMTPFKFDLASFDETPLKSLENDTSKYQQTLLKVLEGERFIARDQLDAESIAPGDVFKDGKHYFINIRPDCDCVARGDKKLDDIELYLLKGSKLTPGQIGKAYDDDHGVLKDNDNETMIFSMRDGASVVFNFKELSLKKWGDLKEKRIGRLLPPYLTRLLQRYSAYMQRPGLTRVPSQAITKPAEPPTGGADDLVVQDNQTIRNCLSLLWAATKRTILEKLNLVGRDK
jgi:hypothetical protein